MKTLNNFLNSMLKMANFYIEYNLSQFYICLSFVIIIYKSIQQIFEKNGWRRDLWDKAIARYEGMTCLQDCSKLSPEEKDQTSKLMGRKVYFDIKFTEYKIFIIITITLKIIQLLLQTLYCFKTFHLKTNQKLCEWLKCDFCH